MEESASIPAAAESEHGSASEPILFGAQNDHRRNYRSDPDRKTVFIQKLPKKVASIDPRDNFEGWEIARINHAYACCSWTSLPDFLKQKIKWRFPGEESGHVTMNSKPSRFPRYEGVVSTDYGDSIVQCFRSTLDDCGFDGMIAIKLCTASSDTLSTRKLEKAKNEISLLIDLLSPDPHPHIVAIIGSYLTETTIGIVMYPVAAWDLAKYLRSISSWNSDHQDSHGLEHTDWMPFENHAYVAYLRSFFTCLCRALSRVHSRRVRHKDIKPANILVDLFQTVMLADFGISKKYAPQNEIRTDGDILMTILYSAPEAQKGVKRGPEADVYSLGCVFLEMLTVILGETLEHLWASLFESDEEGVEHDPDSQRFRQAPIGPKYSYHESWERVGVWVGYLKALRQHRLDNGDHETVTIMSAVSNEAIDAIHSMMSLKESERPKLEDLAVTFQSLPARPCAHCLVQVC
jgi:serine/threonine protein kinase